MRAERIALPQEVRDHLRELCVHEVGFDLDGTILRTPEVYDAAIRETVTILVDDLENQKLIVESDVYFRMAIGKMRNVFEVNPLVMEYPVFALANKLGIPHDDERVDKAVARVQRIFSEDRFILFEGAVSILAAFDRPTLYTHAGEAWTERKITEAGIGVLLGEVVCMDVDRHKRDQWEGWLTQRGVDASDFLMIGDNFQEDVWPIITMGGRAVFVDHGEVFNEIVEKLKKQERLGELNILLSAIENRRFARVRKLGKVAEAFLGMR